MAQNGKEMESLLRDVLEDSSLAASLARKGLETIRNRHTCGHRINELLNLYETIRPAPRVPERIPAGAQA
jgi:spore maturation protein CgeB